VGVTVVPSLNIHGLTIVQVFASLKFELVRTPGQNTWSLCEESEDGEIEETVFRIQGVLCEKELPPWVRKR
jgi:hypothetical protein